MTRAGKGWAGLAAYVLAYDVWAIRRGHESLSVCFGRALTRPTRRPFVTAVWLAISAHLFAALLPPRVRVVTARIDPLGRLARALTPQESK